MPLTSFNTLSKNAGPKLFCEPNPHVLTFVHPILTCTVAHTDALSQEDAWLILAIMITTKVVEPNSKLKLDSNSCEAVVFFPL
jgi:hypothetical protein